MNGYRWSELQVGMTHCFEAVVTSAMMRRFLEDSGDENPLHTDAEFARARGFDRIVVYGLLSSSFYSTLVGVHLPGRYGILQGINVDFVKPIYVDIPLRISGQIVHLSDAVRRVEMTARIDTHTGELLSKAKIRVGLHE